MPFINTAICSMDITAVLCNKCAMLLKALFEHVAERQQQQHIRALASNPNT